MSQKSLRITSYEISVAAINYTLQLDYQLRSNYFVMIRGSSNDPNQRSPGEDHMRVTGDPFGNFTTVTNDNEIFIERGLNNNTWIGVIIVIESLYKSNRKGFILREVIDQSLPLVANGSTTATPVITSTNLTQNCVPFGGVAGGGITCTNTATAQYSPTLGVRIEKTGLNELTFERQGATNTAAACNITTYIVEWGSEWTVQEINATWNSGSDGADTLADYTTFPINPVIRENTWIWKSLGISSDNGLADGTFSKLVTLGDGVNQNAVEATIALGSEAADLRQDTVYVLTHPEIQVEYIFKPDGDNVLTLDLPGFNYTGDEEYESRATEITNVTKNSTRFPMAYWTSAGNGNAYSRPVWDLRFISNTTLRFRRRYSGQEWVSWIQNINFDRLNIEEIGTKNTIY